jgi:hypothetical protein
MKNEEVRMKKETEATKATKADPAATPVKPEHGADSQLHNYNVALTRLGDLFGDDEPLPNRK